MVGVRLIELYQTESDICIDGHMETLADIALWTMVDNKTYIFETNVFKRVMASDKMGLRVRSDIKVVMDKRCQILDLAEMIAYKFPKYSLLSSSKHMCGKEMCFAYTFICVDKKCIPRQLYT